MSPLRYSKTSATNDEVLEVVLRPNIETETKITYDHESPRQISPLGYSEASATNVEMKIPTKLSPKTYSSAINEWICRKEKRY